MTYRVTHVDHHRRRRQLLLDCECRAAAEALAELLYGAAVYLATIRLSGVRP